MRGNYIKGFDYIGLSETWVKEKGWNYIKRKLPDSHRWYNKNAMRKKERGRASGGMLIGINKDWKCEEWEVIGIETEGIMHIRVKEKKEAKYSKCI